MLRRRADRNIFVTHALANPEAWRYRHRMPLGPFIAHFGAPAILAGSAIEGEPFALAGGVIAHSALLPFPVAAGAAIAGAFLVDQFWFLLGRHFRDHRWVRGASARPGFARSIARIERHALLSILLFRFAYGLRIVAPVAIGTSSVATRDFVGTSFVAAVLWGGGFTALGWAFGQSLAPWAGGLAVAGALLALAVLFATFRGLSRPVAAPEPPCS